MCVLSCGLLCSGVAAGVAGRGRGGSGVLDIGVAICMCRRHMGRLERGCTQHWCELGKRPRALARARSVVLADVAPAPAVPISFSMRRSKANEDMHRAVRTWEGHFKTSKCHLDQDINKNMGPSQPILVWAAWWAAQIVVRWAVRQHGRTSFEHAKAYEAKTLVACVDKQLLWRKEGGSH